MTAAIDRLILSGAARVDPTTGRIIRVQTPAAEIVRSAKDIKPEEYSQPFLDFINNNPTVFHTVKYFSERLEEEGFERLSEREAWKLEKGGRYYFTRNGSALVAFAVPEEYEPGNGVGE